MQDKEKRTALTGAAAGLLTAMANIACGYALSARAAGMIAESDALHTEGSKIVNTRGETVVLRGTVYGGDQTLRLIDLCENSRMTEKDFDAMKELGVNCVRIPFRYGDFQDGGDENGFDRFECMVERCAKRGIYVIPALESAPVSQDILPSGGKAGPGGWLDCTLDGLRHRNRVIELWRQIACRFKGNPAVAAYDLLGGLSKKNEAGRALQCFYDRLYRAVRAADPGHIIMFETSWDTEALSNQNKYRWENVIYRLHGRDLADAQIDLFIASLRGKAALLFPVLADVSVRGGLREDLQDACNQAGLGWLAFEWKGAAPADNNRFVYTADAGRLPLPGEPTAAAETKRAAEGGAQDHFTPNEAVIAALRRTLRPQLHNPAAQTQPAGALVPADPVEAASDPGTAAREREALAPVLALGVFTVAGSAAAGIYLKHRQKVLKPKTQK